MDLRKLAFSIDFKGNASPVENMNKATDKLKNSAKGAIAEIDKMGKSMANIGKGMMVKVTTPIVGGIAASINEFAKLEQSIGGVETLFKDSANAVITNSETAYKRAGVSANAYMESVTSFSASLLQGLGGDTEKAAKIADMAMVDMSDNANKFGTDIGAIQNAYQGFAKDNFTMLDNLKLGYGGTAGEMARLINESGVMGKSFKATAENVKNIGFDKMIEAINVTQTAMGVTGTTAKEAMETVAGSIGMAKSSIQDFLGGLGNSKADIGKLTNNMVESFKAVVKNIQGVLSTMWDNIPLEGWQKKLVGIAVAAGPILFIVGSLITKILAIGPALTAVKGAIAVLTGPAGIVIASIVALIAIITHLLRTNEEFRDKMSAIWENIKTTIGSAVDWISSKWAQHGESIISVTSKVFGVIVSFIEVAITTLISVFGGLLTFLSGIGNFLTGVFFGDWSRAWSGIQDMVEGTIKVIEGLWNGLKDLFKKPLTGIVNIFKKEEGVTAKARGKFKVDGSHATGLARVPKNNYVANLHKNEEVLTADDPRNQNNTRINHKPNPQPRSGGIVFSPTYNIELSGTATESDKQEIEKVIDRKTRELFDMFFKEMNMKMA